MAGTMCCRIAEVAEETGVRLKRHTEGPDELTEYSGEMTPTYNSTEVC